MVAEIALAVALVSGAGLLIKSFVALHNVALGFRPENVLVMRATVPGPLAAATAAGAPVLQRYALSNCQRSPACWQPARRWRRPDTSIRSGGYFIDQLPANPDWTRAPSVVLSIVAPGTFAALGIPLKSGRDFSDSDTSDRPFVAVVNEALVRKSFPNQNPLGRTIFCPFDSLKGMTIIGVVGDVRQRRPGARADAGVLHDLRATRVQRIDFEHCRADRRRSQRACGNLAATGAREVAGCPDEVHDHGSHAFGECGGAPISHPAVCGLRGSGRVSCHGWRLWGDGVFRGQRSSEVGLRIALGAIYGRRASARSRAGIGARGSRSGL